MARQAELYEDEAKRRPRGRSLRPLSRLLPYLLRYKSRIAVAFAALSVAAGATLLVPVAVRRVVDFGFTGTDGTLVDRYFAVMMLVVAALAVASAVRFYFVTWLGERVVTDMRTDVFAHLLDLSASYHESQRTGELVSRLTADTAQVKSAFSVSASIALRNLAMLAGSAVMMVVTSPRLSGLVLLAIPPIVLPLIVYGRRVRALSRAAQDTLAGSAAYAQERLSAIAIVQSFTQETFSALAFGRANETAFAAAARRTGARAMLTAAIIILSLGSVVAVLWYGATEVISGGMTGGTLSQFVLYALLAASSLGELSQVWGEVQLAAGAAERLSEILDETPGIAAPAVPGPMPEPARGAVAFDGVTFRYPARPERAALEDVSFTIEPGESVALVGPSGAGKSTVFNLLQRFHDPDSGTVSIDGIDARTADPRMLRSRIAVVPQETMIFAASVADNIRFGKPDAGEAEVKAAAAAAHVDEFVAGLAQGYGTELGERGVTLSGGQRQRIAIARAILRDAPILLLDEATSALDAESEALIQEALARLSAGRTTIAIAHRLATVRNARRIFVFDEGRMIAEGRHGELLKSSPLYARLSKLQFAAA